MEFTDISRIKDLDAIILAVAHKEFENLKRNEIDQWYRNGKKILLDIKGFFDKKEYEDAGDSYWSL